MGEKIETAGLQRKAQARQKAVVEIKSNISLQNDLRTILKGLPDIERLAAKLGALKAGPRDIVHLKVGLQKAMQLKKSVSKFKSPFIKENFLCRFKIIRTGVIFYHKQCAGSIGP